MSDRELLELAAKACGEVQGEWIGNAAYFDGVLTRWNPITDDGDAFRLMVTLGMDVVTGQGRADAYCRGVRVSEYHADDPYAAARRAIVRAAAEIGRRR